MVKGQTQVLWGFWWVTAVMEAHRNMTAALLINSAIFLDMRTTSSKVGYMPSLLIRPGLPQKVHQLSMKPMLLLDTTLTATGSMAGAQKKVILVTSNWCNWESFPLTWINHTILTIAPSWAADYLHGLLLYIQWHVHCHKFNSVRALDCTGIKWLPAWPLEQIKDL